MFKNILFPIDLTEESSWETALPIALGYLKAFGAHINIMTVVSDYGMSLVQQYFPGGSAEEVIEKTRTQLHKFVENNIPAGANVDVIVGRGAVYDSIIETAKKINADLIIMTASRPELKDYLLGPNAAKVVRHSDTSVLVVRTKEEEY